jgi:hypothetical protein
VLTWGPGCFTWGLRGRPFVSPSCIIITTTTIITITDSIIITTLPVRVGCLQGGKEEFQATFFPETFKPGKPDPALFVTPDACFQDPKVSRWKKETRLMLARLMA